MGSSPSAWGTGANDAPPSITSGSAVPTPLSDLTGPGKGTATDATLVDNTSATRAVFPSATPTWQYTFNSPGERAEYYTLTSGAVAGDPKAWRLQGSYDGTTWTTVDERTGQTFPSRLQTRPFKITKPGAYKYYRLAVTANTGEASTTLAEVELLGHPQPACTTTIADTIRGSITVKSGVTCLTATAMVTGDVTVKKGASLRITGATIKGDVSATGAATVSVLGATVNGNIKITGSGPVSVEATHIGGTVNLGSNSTSTLVSANTVKADLKCSGNTPAPVNNDLPNNVKGSKSGQCRAL
jgi:hypothetical protein